jgi:pimeloyl-ACP methyl ester carboxylesterase
LALVDVLAIDSVILVGVALGAWAALQMATKSTARIDRLVLASPLGVKTGSRDELVMPDVFAMTSAQLNSLVYRDPISHCPDLSHKTDEELTIVARNRETLALLTWEPYMHDPKLCHRLHRIDRPTLILRGENDGLLTPSNVEAYARLIGGGRTETIARAGHRPQIEQPRAFVDCIAQFCGAARD